MSNQEELQAIIVQAPSIERANFVFLSSAVWFFWDWAISLDSEIQYFWGKRLTSGSCLYFSNRIMGATTLALHFFTNLLPLTPATSAKACKPLIFSVLAAGNISTSIVQTVLVLRTYALWDCNKKILWFLMGLNIISSLTQQGLVAAIWGPNVVSVPWNPLPPPYTSCFITFHLGTWERYIPIIVFESAVACLLIRKFVDYARQGRSHRVLYVLFRDGFIEFTAISISSMLSLFLGISRDRSGSDYFTHISYDVVASISMVCCARMLLNIRDIMSLSDPLDTTKPNPWTLSPSFDERYGRDPHNFTAVPDGSQMEMFETFFGDGEPILDEQINELLPRVSGGLVPTTTPY